MRRPLLPAGSFNQFLAALSATSLLVCVEPFHSSLTSLHKLATAWRHIAVKTNVKHPHAQAHACFFPAIYLQQAGLSSPICRLFLVWPAVRCRGPDLRSHECGEANAMKSRIAVLIWRVLGLSHRAVKLATRALEYCFSPCHISCFAMA